MRQMPKKRFQVYLNGELGWYATLQEAIDKAVADTSQEEIAVHWKNDLIGYVNGAGEDRQFIEFLPE